MTFSISVTSGLAVLAFAVAFFVVGMTLAVLVKVVRDSASNHDERIFDDDGRDE